MNRKLVPVEYRELRWRESQLHESFWHGSSRNSPPDYLIRLTSGKILVIEVKGEETYQSNPKHAAMRQWVDVVNEQEGFGKWEFAVANEPFETSSFRCVVRIINTMGMAIMRSMKTVAQKIAYSC